jgi:aminobenzoyl-glutamate utilization protein B
MQGRLLGILVLAVSTVVPLAAQSGNAKLAAQKKQAVARVDEMAKLAQEMVDSVFSFGELAFQEVETSRYLTGILEKHGFKVQRGVSGIPTAWIATYGSGKPVIALGSDIDGIPQASQKPGVAYHDPIIPGAPGHGEGHNSGMPLNVVAAIAVKEIMERDKLPGTLMLWPGVAEEVVASSRTLTSACSRTSAPTSRCRGVTMVAAVSCRSSTRSRARAPIAPARRGAADRRSTPSS